MRCVEIRALFLKILGIVYPRFIRVNECDEHTSKEASEEGEPETLLLYTACIVDDGTTLTYRQQVHWANKISIGSNSKSLQCMDRRKQPSCRGCCKDRRICT